MKKIGILLLIGCFTLTLSGCKGKEKDFNKQYEKFEEILDEGDLFEKDYDLKVSGYKKENGETILDINYHVEKDYNNYWFKQTSMVNGKEIYTETWLGKKNNKSYFFENNNGTKEYSEIDYYDVLEEDFDLEENYDSYYELIKTIKRTCYGNISEQEKKTMEFSCSIEKSIFGKVTVTYEIDYIDDEDRYDTYIVSFKGGKIVEYTEKYVTKTSESQFNFKYKYINQIVKLPDTDDYKRK